MKGILSGKKGVIMGIANDRSISWGIAKAAAEQGAEMIFSYQGEVLKKRVEPLAQSIGVKTLIECDASNEESIKEMFKKVEAEFGEIDFILHGIAFSDKNELKGRFVDTTKSNFLNTMDISCYSLVSVIKNAEHLMKNGGSVVTLTYYGAEKVVPNYNVMGVAKAALEASVQYLAADLGQKNIRVNAISSGPIKTLAASGISDFKTVLNYNEQNAPLRKNVTIEEVGGVGAFLFSHMSGGITGENIHVDSGYHVIGMPVAVKDE